jgi:hypothetical protein
MQPPTDPGAPAAAEPGERRRLDHPPSDRYATPPPDDALDGLPSQRVIRALAAAVIGAAVMTLLGGPLSVTVGLLGIAAVTGWAVGSLARPSLGLAVGIALGSVAVGLVGIWLFARFEGGVLGLPDYLAAVHGLLVPLEFAVAGLVAAATVR